MAEEFFFKPEESKIACIPGDHIFSTNSSVMGKYLGSEPEVPEVWHRIEGSDCLAGFSKGGTDILWGSVFLVRI